MDDHLYLCAWARRWHIDKEPAVPVLNPETGRMKLPGKFKILPVTAGRCFPDDVPLYAKLSDIKGK